MRRSRRHLIYPVFLPHAGCPFRCVYCNQVALVSSSYKAEPAGKGLLTAFREQVDGFLKEALRAASPGELAFYGGTFSALPKPALEAILMEAAHWVGRGVFSGIRFSTRPDALSGEICELLAQYPVSTVELGVQSLNDEVLIQSRRGYTSETVYHAASRVRQAGWNLGLQLMVGLPGDSRQAFSETVLRAVEMKPDLVRIYPTLVVAGTELALWYRKGTYVPLTLNESLGRCASAFDLLHGAGISVARMGLHPDPQLLVDGTVLAGPRHPSFGYLVRVRWWRERVDHVLGSLDRPARGRAKVRVRLQAVSEAVGPSRCNPRYWELHWNLAKITVEGVADQPYGQVAVSWE